MNCLKCGSNIVPGDKFCRNCGTAVNFEQSNTQSNNQIQYNQEVQDNNQVSQYNQNNVGINNQQVNQPGIVYQTNQNTGVNSNYYNQNNDQQIAPDEDLKKAYIGKDYDLIKQKRGLFPLWIFLFNSLYFLYRKMYLYGFLWIVGSIILSTFLPIFSFFILFGIKIFFMIKFYDIYDKYVTEKVNKIKSENPNCDRNQLINICSKKGGTNIIVAVMLPILILIVTLLITIPIIFGVIDEAENNVDKSSVYNYINSVEKEIVSNKINDFDYEVPSVITNVDDVNVTETKPDSIVLHFDKSGQITSGTLTYGSKVFEYNNGELTEK